MLSVEDLKLGTTSKGATQPLHFKIAEHQVWAVIGPNGSGKSALLELIANGPADPEGKIVIHHFNAHHEPDKAKALVGYLPNPVRFEPYLTGYEFLELVSSFYHLSPEVRSQRILSLAERLGCRDYLFTNLERLGAALHQKIGLIASLIHQPKVLLWDEPLQHLDHHSQSAALELLQETAAAGAACLVATNDLELAQIIGQHFLLLDNGELVAQGSLAQLTNQFQTDRKDLAAVYHQALHT